MKRPLAVSAVSKRISEQVYEQACQGRCVLTLGGDHSISIGTLAGTAEATRERLSGKEVGVIWVNAHAHINTPDTTKSGNLHGMALAFPTGVAKGDREDMFGWLKPKQMISPKKLVYIALRDVDDGEEVIIKQQKIKVFKMDEIKSQGINSVMDQALAYIGNDTPIHLSYDIDGLDPTVAPSTGTTVPGGLTLDQGKYIGTRVHETGNLVSLDLVMPSTNFSFLFPSSVSTLTSVSLFSSPPQAEINPQVAPESSQKTVTAAISLVQSALGQASN